MKVIEYGHIEPVRARCNGCGALLEFSVRESMYCKGKLFVPCIMCGAMVYEDDWEQQDVKEVKLFNPDDLEYIF